MTNLTPSEKILSAKIRIARKNPFFAVVVGQLELVEVEPNHSTIHTMATNGRHLYYNPVFVDALSREGVMFGVLHETMHVILLSLSRKGNRKFHLWNCATDYVINQMIKDAGYPVISSEEMTEAFNKVRRQFGSKDIKNASILLNDTYRDKTAEEIYEILASGDNGINGKGINLPSGGNGNGDGDGDGEKSNNRSLETFDEHINEDGGPQSHDSGSGNETVIWKPSASEKQKIERQILTTIESASRGMSSSHVPKDILRRINELTQSRISWRDILRNKVSPSNQSDYDWASPDHNFYSKGITIPSLDTGEELNAVLVIDTSGSISDEAITQVMSEMVDICSLYHDYNLKVIVFGSDVVDVTEFKTGDDISEYAPPFGGGTCFRSFFAYLAGETEFDGKSHSIEETDVVIVFTDGFGEGWFEEYSSMMELVWVIDEMGQMSGVEPSWGTVVHYDKYA